MATSGPPTTWKNADGLFVRFGGTEVVPGIVGSYEDHLGGDEVLEARVYFGTSLPTSNPAYPTIGTASTGSGALLDPNGAFFIPKTAFIKAVEITVVTALAGGTSVSMGLNNDDATYTAIDATGLLNAETQSHLGTAGRVWRYTVSGGFLDGAPGTTSAQQGTSVGGPPGGGSPVLALPTVYTVGTFTAGALDVRIILTYDAKLAILT